MSTQNASKALLSRLAETVIEEFNRDDLYVAQVPAGVILGREHFEVLQKLASDRLDDPESVARLVEISRIVDCIQVHEETVVTPEETPGFLSDRFPQIIENVQFVSAPLGEAKQRHYDQAQALLYEDPPFIKRPEYTDFCLLRADLEKKEVALTEMRLNLQRTENPEEQSVLASETALFENLVKEQREALEALDRVHNFQSAETIIDAAEREVDSIPTAVREMLDSMELLQISDPISHVTHVGCNFSPSHLSEDNWIPLKLTREDIAKWNGTGKTGENGDIGLEDDEIDTITLEVQTVLCSRAWLWSALFENQHWRWQSPSQPVSDGTLDGSTDTIIPGYIYGLVLARNVVVKGKPSAQQQFAKAKLKAGSKTVMKADLLTQAITPIQTLTVRPLKPVSPGVQPAVSTLQARPTAKLRLQSAVASGQVAPLISRSAVQPVLAEPTLAQPAQLNLNQTAVLRQPTPNLAPQLNTQLVSSNLLKHRIEVLQRVTLMMPARGRVVAPQGRGLYQAVVTIQTPSGERRVHTGQDGHFTAQVAQGRYGVKVDKPGFMTAKGFISVPQKGNPLVITMTPISKEQLKILLVEPVSGGTCPFVGFAKVTIEGNNTRQVEIMNNQSEMVVSLQPGGYTVTLVSEMAEKVAPTRQSVEVRSQAGNNNSGESKVIFTIYPAPQISNPEVQLLGVICRRVPPCPV